jgi:hypothetical protein
MELQRPQQSYRLLVLFNPPAACGNR